MNPLLRAGVELTLEKMAAQEARGGPLATTLRQKIAEVQNEVVETGNETAPSPSSAKGRKMENTNKGFGKGPDNPSPENDPGAKEDTGQTANAHAGPHVTTEASGMPDLSLPKKARGLSPRGRALRTMLAAATRG